MLSGGVWLETTPGSWRSPCAVYGPLVHRAGSEAKLSPELIAFLHGGVAASVATRDAENRPSATRGWGPLVAEDGWSLTLCVVAPPGSATRANPEQNGAIAVGFSPPTIARAVQVKGFAVGMGEAEREDLERAARHFEAFLAEVETIGFALELARQIYDEADLVSVRMSIEEVFDQTPGPTAGRRL